MSGPSLRREARRFGILPRLVLGRALTVIRSSWQMYPLGFLLGLGFDTASEIAVLGISAARGVNSRNVPRRDAGLSTSLCGRHDADRHDRQHCDDRHLRLGLHRPPKKAPLQHHDHTGLCSGRLRNRRNRTSGAYFEIHFHLDRGVWAIVAQFNEHFVALGLAVAAIFASVWIGSLAMLAMSDPNSEQEVPSS